MHSRDPIVSPAARQARTTDTGGTTSGVPESPLPPSGGGRAAQGPIPDAVSAAAGPAPGSPADAPAAAQGRRTLSTAFVRLGPGARLVVEQRDGSVVVLRDVVMRPKDYCGVREIAGGSAVRYCGAYAGVAAARAGSAPDIEEPEQAEAKPIVPSPAQLE